MAVVYKIKNDINGDFYVGFTSKNPPEKRFSEHKCCARKSSPAHLHRAMKKYGSDNFSFIILESTNDREYGQRVLEPQYIAELKPKYNMTDGGEVRSGYRLSEESKQKISITHKGVADGPMKEAHKWLFLWLYKKVKNSKGAWGF